MLFAKLSTMTCIVVIYFTIRYYRYSSSDRVDSSASPGKINANRVGSVHYEFRHHHDGHAEQNYGWRLR
jgi:hypothetical protein